MPGLLIIKSLNNKSHKLTVNTFKKPINHSINNKELNFNN